MFLGPAGHFRRFVHNFSSIAKPLYDIMQKGSQFKFGPEENRAFETLRDKLSSYPVSAIYSPKAETQLHCDASAHGFGMILIQKQKNNLYQPISYFSHHTTQNESKDHSFKLECLAAIYAIKRFHIYLSGIKFKIITKCDSFKLTFGKKDVNSRISRWAILLQN